MENNDKLFNVKIYCINSTNIYNVKFKYIQSKSRLFLRLYDSLIICTFIVNVFSLLSITYKFFLVI